MLVLQFICNRCNRIEGQVITLKPGEATYIDAPDGWDREKIICPDCVQEITKEELALAESDKVHEV